MAKTRTRHPPDRYQQTGVLVLYVAGLIPLMLALKPQVGLFIGSLLVLAGVSIRWPRLRPRTWLLGLLTVTGGLNVLDAYDSLVGRDPGTALLVTMLALKLLEVRSLRDVRVLLLLFGFLQAVQFLFNDAAALAVLLTLLLVANIALMVDVTLGDGKLAARGRTLRALALAGRTTLLALPMAVLLFLFFPRLDAPLWDLGLNETQARSGLKDWLEPGSVSELVISGEDALRVRFDEKPGISSDAMYWRGPILWHTDGRRWSPARGGEFPDATPEVIPEGRVLQYTVMIEPTDQRWLIGLDMPYRLPSDAVATPDFQVLAASPIEKFRIYRMASAPRYRTVGLSLDEEAAALALPSNVTDRMRELALSWTRSGADAEQIVAAALRYFNEVPFRYTLMPPLLGDNPADDFLFETRSGFCEHYASSFVLLMRIAGVPARIVLGYLGGEFNPLSGDYLIRQSDAHAWSEVWIEGKGWVRVDPTAAVASERVDPDSRLTGLGSGAPVRFRLDDKGIIAQAVRMARLAADALDAGWTSWVIGFSNLKQRQLLDAIGLDHLRGPALVLAVGATTLMLLWSLVLARPAEAGDAAEQAWARLSRKLGRVGLARLAQEGPVDYRDRVCRARPDLAGPVRGIVELYLRCRYRPGAHKRDGAALRRQVGAFRPRRRR